MARKQFNFVLSASAIIVQQLAYADQDAEATVADEKSFEVADIPAELQNGENTVVSLAAYGLSQILQDRSSSVAQADKLERMTEVFDTLKGGQWKEQRASSGGTRKASIDVYFASGFSKFLESKGKVVDTVTATTLLQGMSADERKALRASDQIKPFIEQARDAAETAASDIDLTDLLG